LPLVTAVVRSIEFWGVLAIVDQGVDQGRVVGVCGECLDGDALYRLYWQARVDYLPILAASVANNPSRAGGSVKDVVVVLVAHCQFAHRNVWQTVVFWRATQILPAQKQQHGAEKWQHEK